MSDRERLISDLDGFFKNQTYLRDLESILDSPPSSLVGVDNISSKSLISNGINSIRALSELSLEKPPFIAQVPPNMLLKWISIAILIKKLLSGQVVGQAPGVVAGPVAGQAPRVVAGPVTGQVPILTKREKKVIMVGLDNAGKTSLLSVMKRNFSSLKDILPTKGVQRESLSLFGFPIISWDLGGQVQFRENWYFEKPELYFTEASLMIYVIDVQDRERFGESGAYLTRILEILKALGEEIPILIALNKSDPDVVSMPIWGENVKSIGELINPVLEQHGFGYDYAMTSIYQTATVTQMFSTSLQKFSETSEIIKYIIDDYGASISALSLSLISTAGMVFGTYGENDTYKELLNDTAITLFTLEGFYKSKGLIPEKTIIFELIDNNLIMRGEKLFEYTTENIPVFLWFLSKKSDILDDRLEQIKNELYPLVKLLM